MKKNTLYLASQSNSRKKLLDLADIPYKTITHKSTEEAQLPTCDVAPEASFEEYVLAIAQDKMKHAQLPQVAHDTIFVLTSDTLMRAAKTKQILGKPIDRAHAERMLALLREQTAELVTGCCLEKMEWEAFTSKDGAAWKTVEKKHWVTPATLDFCVPPEMVDRYFEKMPYAMVACGAGIIEDFGLNFLKNMTGSFTTIMGLPLYELREALTKMGFFTSPN